MGRCAIAIVLIALGPLGACTPREYDRSFDLDPAAGQSRPQILPLAGILASADTIPAGPPPVRGALDTQNAVLTSRAAGLPAAGIATDDLAPRADALRTRSEALRNRQ